MTKEPKQHVEVRHVRDLIPDKRNANKGTVRGGAALSRSMEELGAARSIVLDKNGNIIAGNKAHETFGAIGGEEVIIVHTTGNQLVAVQRDDLDINDLRGRKLAYADNRVAELDLEWDAERIAEDIANGVDVGDFWRDDELEKTLRELADGLELSVEDDGEEDTYSATDFSGAETSHVRMIQLFLDSTTHPEFVTMVEAVAPRYGTTNPTDTVMAILREAYFRMD